MKKVLAVILALVMLLTLSLSLSGCNNGDNLAQTGSDGGKIQVVAGSNKSTSGQTEKDVYIDFFGIWQPDHRNAKWLIEKGNEFAAKFEQETGISVEFVYVGQESYGGVRDKLVSGAVTNELPVLSQLGATSIAECNRLFADLSTLLPKEVLDNYVDGLPIKYNNKTVSVPFGVSYTILIVNEELVTQAGHTVDDFKTWDDFHQIAKDIAALGDNIEGYCINWDTDAWRWEGPLYSNGGQVVTDDGKRVTFADHDEGAVFMSLVKDMLLDGSCIQYYDAGADHSGLMHDKFLSGELGILYDSIAAYGGLLNERKENDYSEFKITLVHQPAGKGGNWVTTGGSHVMILEKGTETQKKVAAKFLEYLAEDKNAVEFSQLSRYMINTKSAAQSSYYAELAKDPNQKIIETGIKHAHLRPQTPHWPEMNVYLTNRLMEFVMNPEQYDPIALNKEMAVYCQKIIDESET